INAAVRPHGLSYSRFIHLLDEKGVVLSRKVLADLAVTDPQSFSRLVEDIQKSGS
ncbi:50S ribosomal protein L20, partial [bacterium]|nr:50S ribosomal protein L20 [bacterium]